MQHDTDSTSTQLLDELEKLRQRNSELEKSNAQLTQAYEISRRNSAILHALNEVTTNLICVKDKQGKVIMANPAMLRFIGRSESDVIGKDDLDFLANAAQAKQIRENDHRIMDTRCSETIEETIDWPNRTWSCLFTKSPYLDEHGDVIGVIGIGTDITERKQTESLLKESEKRFKDIFDFAIDGILIADSHTRKFQEANKAMCQMLGYSPEELKSLGLENVHPAETLPSAFNLFDKMVRGDSTVLVELPILKKDGSIFYADVTAHPMIWDGKQCLIGFFRDVTERKQHEAALRESEERFKSVAESSIDAIYISDQKGTIMFWNKAAAKTFGYQESEVLGKDQSILLPKRLVKMHNEARNKTIAKASVSFMAKPIETVAVRKDGSEFPVELTVSNWKEENQYYFSAIIRDITLRRQQEESLKTSEARFRAIAESSLDAIVTSDSSGKILYWNKAAETIYGYKAEELVGKAVQLLIPGRRRPIERKARRIFMSTGQPDFKGQRMEAVGLKKGGTEFPTETSFSSWEADGEIYFSGIIRDITERKQKEEQLKKSHDELEKKVKQRTAELRSANEKLQISQDYLKKFAGMLLSAREEERKNISTTIHDELGSMAIAIDSQLSIAREECNKKNKRATFKALTDAQIALRKAVEDLRKLAVDLRPPNLEIMGLSAALTELIDKTKQQAKFKIDFRNELGKKKIPSDTAIVIYRVIQEALTNISKHARAKNALVRLYTDKTNIYLEIADDGAGLNLDKIVNTSKKAKLKIGIEGMRERVESLGGEFTIESAPKQGIQLKAHLPKK